MAEPDPRTPRRGGRRHSRVSWRALSTSSTVATAATSVAALVGGRVDLAMRSLLAFGSASSAAARMATRQGQPQADDVDDFGRLEDSVLYLRSFADDRVPFSQTDARHDRRPVEKQLAFLWSDPDEEFLSFERYVGPELTRQIGPMVGLGGPGDGLPPEGPVVRHYADDGDWQEIAARLIRSARCIVMLPQVTDALEIELGLIHRFGCAGKLFVVTGPYAGTGAGDVAPLRLRIARTALRARPTPWTDLVTAFGTHQLTLPRADPGPGSVIGFDADGSGVVVTSGASRAAAYVEAMAGRLPPGPA